MFLSEFGKCNILFKTCHSGFVFVFNPKSPCPAMNGIFKYGLPIKKKRFRYLLLYLTNYFL